MSILSTLGKIAVVSVGLYGAFELGRRHGVSKMLEDITEGKTTLHDIMTKHGYTRSAPEDGPDLSTAVGLFDHYYTSFKTGLEYSLIHSVFSLGVVEGVDLPIVINIDALEEANLNPGYYVVDLTGLALAVGETGEKKMIDAKVIIVVNDTHSVVVIKATEGDVNTFFYAVLGEEAGKYQDLFSHEDDYTLIERAVKGDYIKTETTAEEKAA